MDHGNELTRRQSNSTKYPSCCSKLILKSLPPPHPIGSKELTNLLAIDLLCIFMLSEQKSELNLSINVNPFPAPRSSNYTTPAHADL